MSIKHIRDYYDVPAKIGGALKFTDGDGIVWNCTIFSTVNSHLKVRVEGMPNKNGYWLLHPTWNIEYL